MQEVTSATRGDLCLKIYQDDIATDPRADEHRDHFSTFACFHSEHRLGDRFTESTKDDFLDALAREVLHGYGQTLEIIYRMFCPGGELTDGYLSAEETFRRQVLDERCLLLPLHFRDYGSGALRFWAGGHAARWEGDAFGWAYVTHEEIRREYDIPEGEPVSQEVVEKALQLMAAEVEEYAQYLSGDVYGFRLVRLERDEDGEPIEDEEAEELDSCWGFYGHDWQANGIIDHVGAEHADLVAAL
jgi:hypothetical protein